MYKKKCSLLIAYPDNKLKQTWEDEMKLWGYKNEDVTFVNFSSIKNYIGYLFDFIIIDEFHSASENERNYFLAMFDERSKVLALSGTVSKDTKFDWQLPLIAKYSTEDGIQDGILANYQITVHFVNLDTLTLVKDAKGKMKSEKHKYDAYSWVIDKLRRQGASTMFMALARNRLSQSSIGKLNYLKKLLSTLSDKRVLVFTGLAKVADSIGIPSYHSKSKDDSNFKKFQAGEENHLALAAMGKVGVTYPELDCVILINFTYNAEESSQILNRAIKLDYTDKIADLHVIALNEPPEIKKVKESLSMLDQKKIKYVTV
jgi:superfamily II DNA or RNA helicase